jgi:tetratricopeptide (TPR) repeat protein
LGNWNAAVADFNAALALDPDSYAALIGCIDARLHQGAFREATTLAHRGLELHEDAGRQAPFHAKLAQINVRQQKWSEALIAWRDALRSPRPEIDWFLGEAESLAQLGHAAERTAALAQAMQRNPSIVLRRAWINALVDAGELEPAMREIEAGLGHARWKSSWLLLRARVHAERRDPVRQEADASAALTEILTRLNPNRPDPHLVAEAEAARALGAQE